MVYTIVSGSKPSSVALFQNRAIFCYDMHRRDRLTVARNIEIPQCHQTPCAELIVRSEATRSNIITLNSHENDPRVAIQWHESESS